MKIFSGKTSNKKSSLSLSVNAIVILILAITMLGLGLTFVRKMFGGAGGKLGKVIATTSLKEPPSADKPLTVDSTISIKQGKSIETQIGFYNRHASDINTVKPIIVECYKAGEEEPEQKSPSLTTPATPVVHPGKDTAYSVIIDISTTELQRDYTVGKTFICSLAMKGETDDTSGTMPSGDCESGDAENCDAFETTQFFMKITS